MSGLSRALAMPANPVPRTGSRRDERLEVHARQKPAPAREDADRRGPLGVELVERGADASARRG
jgi:hypothetical protein